MTSSIGTGQSAEGEQLFKVPIELTHKDGVFHCKLCRNDTKSRNAFEEHMAAHIQSHPYVCIKCKMKFIFMSEMNEHIKVSHENEKVQCGMKGIKVVKKLLDQLLKEGSLKFKGFATKKKSDQDGCVQSNFDGKLKIETANVALKTEAMRTTVGIEQVQETNIQPCPVSEPEIVSSSVPGTYQSEKDTDKEIHPRVMNREKSFYRERNEISQENSEESDSSKTSSVEVMTTESLHGNVNKEQVATSQNNFKQFGDDPGTSHFQTESEKMDIVRTPSEQTLIEDETNMSGQPIGGKGNTDYKENKTTKDSISLDQCQKKSSVSKKTSDRNVCSSELSGLSSLCGKIPDSGIVEKHISSVAVGVKHQLHEENLDLLNSDMAEEISQNRTLLSKELLSNSDLCSDICTAKQTFSSSEIPKESRSNEAVAQTICSFKESSKKQQDNLPAKERPLSKVSSQESSKIEKMQDSFHAESNLETALTSKEGSKSALLQDNVRPEKTITQSEENSKSELNPKSENSFSNKENQETTFITEEGLKSAIFQENLPAEASTTNKASLGKHSKSEKPQDSLPDDINLETSFSSEESSTSNTHLDDNPVGVNSEPMNSVVETSTSSPQQKSQESIFIEITSKGKFLSKELSKPSLPEVPGGNTSTGITNSTSCSSLEIEEFPVSEILSEKCSEVTVHVSLQQENSFTMAAKITKSLEGTSETFDTAQNSSETESFGHILPTSAHKNLTKPVYSKSPTKDSSLSTAGKSEHEHLSKFSAFVTPEVNNPETCDSTSCTDGCKKVSKELQQLQGNSTESINTSPDTTTDFDRQTNLIEEENKAKLESSVSNEPVLSREIDQPWNENKFINASMDKDSSDLVKTPEKEKNSCTESQEQNVEKVGITVSGFSWPYISPMKKSRGCDEDSVNSSQESFSDLQEVSTLNDQIISANIPSVNYTCTRSPFKAHVPSTETINKTALQTSTISASVCRKMSYTSGNSTPTNPTFTLSSQSCTSVTSSEICSSSISRQNTSTLSTINSAPIASRDATPASRSNKNVSFGIEDECHSSIRDKSMHSSSLISNSGRVPSINEKSNIKDNTPLLSGDHHLNISGGSLPQSHSTFQKVTEDIIEKHIDKDFNKAMYEKMSMFNLTPDKQKLVNTSHFSENQRNTQNDMSLPPYQPTVNGQTTIETSNSGQHHPSIMSQLPTLSKELPACRFMNTNLQNPQTLQQQTYFLLPYQSSNLQTSAMTQTTISHKISGLQSHVPASVLLYPNVSIPVTTTNRFPQIAQNIAPLTQVNTLIAPGQQHALPQSNFMQLSNKTLKQHLLAGPQAVLIPPCTSFQNVSNQSSTFYTSMQHAGQQTPTFIAPTTPQANIGLRPSTDYMTPNFHAERSIIPSVFTTSQSVSRSQTLLPSMPLSSTTCTSSVPQTTGAYTAVCLLPSNSCSLPCTSPSLTTHLQHSSTVSEVPSTICRTSVIQTQFSSINSVQQYTHRSTTESSPSNNRPRNIPNVLANQTSNQGSAPVQSQPERQDLNQKKIKLSSSIDNSGSLSGNTEDRMTKRKQNVAEDTISCAEVNSTYEQSKNTSAAKTNSGLGRDFLKGKISKEVTNKISEILKKVKEQKLKNITTDQSEVNKTASSGESSGNLTSGTGDRTLTSGTGDRTLTIGTGDRTLTSGTGDSSLTSGTGDRILTSGTGDSALTSRTGDSTLTSRTGDSTTTTGTPYEVDKTSERIRKKKNEKAQFRKVGQDFLCILCQTETQSETDFCYHVWNHFHIKKTICTHCQTNQLVNPLACTLVASVMDGLKFGCSSGTPCGGHIKTESVDEDDDVIIIDDPVKEKETLITNIKQEITSVQNTIKEEITFVKSTTAVKHRLSVEKDDRGEESQEHVREEERQIDAITHTAKDLPVTPERLPSPAPDHGTGNFYICTFTKCEFSCGNLKKFQEHLMEKHGDEYEFKCVHCGYQSNSVQGLVKHMHSHLKSTAVFFRCCVTGCQFETNIMKDYHFHLVKCHSAEKSLSCTSCQEKFASADSLLEHLKTNFLKVVQCPHCTMKSTDSKLIKSHITLEHPDKSRQIVVNCQLVCHARGTYNFTSSPSHTPIVSDFSPSSSPGPGASDVRIASPAPETLKESSEKQVTNCINLQQEHATRVSTDSSQKTVKERRKSSNSETEKNYCHKSPESVSNRDTSTHPNASSGLVQSGDSLLEKDTSSSLLEKDTSSTSMLYKCPMCSFTSRGKLPMRHHEKIHNLPESLREKKVFQCPLCPYSSNVLKIFTEHISCHIGNNIVDIYHCTLCDAISTEKDIIVNQCEKKHTTFQKELHISLKKIQTSFAAHVCEVCDYCTTSKALYDKHSESHLLENHNQPTTTETSAIQKCPYCIFYTNNEVLFETHIKSQHKKRLEAVKRNRRLSSDKHTPNQSKPKSSASVRETAKHTDTLQDQSDQSEITSHQRTDKSESDIGQKLESNRFYCPECKTGVTSMDELTKHLKVHPEKDAYNIKVLKCFYCDYRTTEIALLSRHHADNHRKLLKATTKQQLNVEQPAPESVKNQSQASLNPHLVKEKKPFTIPAQNPFPQPVACSECDYSTTERNALIIHVSTKHPTLYPTFEDEGEMDKKDEDEEEISDNVKKDKTRRVSKDSSNSGKQFQTTDVLIPTENSEKSSDVSSGEDSEQDVLDLLTDESTEDEEKPSTCENNKSQSNKEKRTTRGSNQFTSDSKDCETVYRLGGDVLHSRLKPCYRIDKSKEYICDICEDKFQMIQRYDLHKHLLNHMDLWYFMCGFCEFTSFEIRQMENHFTTKHKSLPRQILKMKEDCRNRINQVVHCRKAGVSVSSFVAAKPWSHAVSNQTIDENIEIADSDAEAEMQKTINGQIYEKSEKDEKKNKELQLHLKMQHPDIKGNAAKQNAVDKSTRVKQNSNAKSDRRSKLGNIIDTKTSQEKKLDSPAVTKTKNSKIKESEEKVKERLKERNIPIKKGQVVYPSDIKRKKGFPKCPLCPYSTHTYSCTGNLYRHLRDIHKANICLKYPKKTAESQLTQVQSHSQRPHQDTERTSSSGKVIVYTYELQPFDNGSYECHLCQTAVAAKYSMYRHLREVHHADIREGYRCLSCRKTMKTKCEFLNHLSMVPKCNNTWFICSSKTWTCPKNRKLGRHFMSFSRKKIMEHIKQDHSEYTRKKPIVIGTKTGKAFYSLVRGSSAKQRYRSNLESNTEKFSQESVSGKTSVISTSNDNETETPSTRGNFKEKLNYSGKGYEIVCGDCNLVCANGLRLQLHINRHHPMTSLLCSYCNEFSTISVRHIIYHTLLVHKQKKFKFYRGPWTEASKSVAKKILAVFKKGPTSITMEKANEFFQSLPDKRESSANVSKKPLKLLKEVKQLKLPSSNPSSQKDVTWLYRCAALKDCEYTCCKRDDMYRHLQKHFNYRPYKCGYCNIQCTKEEYIRMHHTKVHGNKNVKIVVDRKKKVEAKIEKLIKQCFAGKETGRAEQIKYQKCKMNLTSEEKSILRNGPKRIFSSSTLNGKKVSYQCKKCQYRTISHSAIVSHVHQIHFPQIYQCPFCDVTGYPRTKISGHIKINHPKENPRVQVINRLRVNGLSDTDVYSGDEDSLSDSGPKDPKSLDPLKSESKSPRKHPEKSPNRSRAKKKRLIIQSDSEDDIENRKSKKSKADNSKHGSSVKSDKVCTQKSKKESTDKCKNKKTVIQSDSEDDFDIKTPKKTEKDHLRSVNEESVYQSKTKTASVSKGKKKPNFIDSDSEEDEKVASNKREVDKAKRSKKRLVSSSDKDSSSQTDESDDKDDDSEEESQSDIEDVLKSQKKRVRPLSGDESDDTIDIGPTRYFCHQCCYRSDDIQMYCRHLVTHGGFSQLSTLPHHHNETDMPHQDGTTFRCAYCEFGAANSFRAKQHITMTHPDKFVNYTEIRTKGHKSKVMLVAMQPTIEVRDICKMELLELASLLSKEGVIMNSKNRKCDKAEERSQSSGEKRKIVSIMTPSKYYKKSDSHKDVRENHQVGDEKSGGRASRDSIVMAKGCVDGICEVVPSGLKNVEQEPIEMDRKTLETEKTDQETLEITHISTNASETEKDQKSVETNKNSLEKKIYVIRNKLCAGGKARADRNFVLSEPGVSKTGKEILPDIEKALGSESRSLQTAKYEDISDNSDNSQGPQTSNETQRLRAQVDFTGNIPPLNMVQGITPCGLTSSAREWASVTFSGSRNIEQPESLYENISECSESISNKDDLLYEDISDSSVQNDTLVENDEKQSSGEVTITQGQMGLGSSTLKGGNSREATLSSGSKENLQDKDNYSNEFDEDGDALIRSVDLNTKSTESSNSEALQTALVSGMIETIRSQFMTSSNNVLGDIDGKKISTRGGNLGNKCASACALANMYRVNENRNDSASGMIKGGNSNNSPTLPEITSDNVISSIDNLLDSLSAIGQRHQTDSSTKRMADTDRETDFSGFEKIQQLHVDTESSENTTTSDRTIDTEQIVSPDDLEINIDQSGSGVFMEGNAVSEDRALETNPVGVISSSQGFDRVTDRDYSHDSDNDSVGFEVHNDFDF